MGFLADRKIRKVLDALAELKTLKDKHGDEIGTLAFLLRVPAEDIKRISGKGEQVTGVRRFRKKPIEVRAVRWTGDNLAAVQAFAGADFREGEECAQVYDKLHDTWMNVYDGQWVIEGVQGEFYPIAPDVLAATYEEIREG